MLTLNEKKLLFQHSLMNLGVETRDSGGIVVTKEGFQHSLMNLGVETSVKQIYGRHKYNVSAFSDESWGGDLGGMASGVFCGAVSAFSDESWGGDQASLLFASSDRARFSIL